MRGSLARLRLTSRGSPLCGALVLVALVVACDDGGGEEALVVRFSDEELARVLARSPVPLAPTDETNAFADDARAFALGKSLFFDARLASDGESSCASCHDPDHGFGDPRRFSEAIGVTTRHAPALWNAAFQRWLFWDGRADSLWAQALGPIENPIEMGNDRVHVVRTVFLDDEWRTAYEELFGPLPPLDDGARFPAHARPDPDPESALAQAWSSMSEDDRALVDRAFANLGKAIAAYEMRLVSRGAPFDRFVKGLRDDDDDAIAALAPAAQRGLKLFVGDAGCFFCHTGPLFTDLEFHNLAPPDAAYDLGRAVGIPRLLADPFNAAGAFSDDREGVRALRLRFLTATIEQDGQMRTPSLRNVALSPPYMHHGGLATLDDVVAFYNALPPADPALPGHREDSLIPRALDDDDEADLVAFLESLTDDTIDPALLP